jgi:hypothetical protein
MHFAKIAAVVSLSFALASAATAQAPSGAGALPGGSVGTGVNNGATVPPSTPASGTAVPAESAVPGEAVAPDHTTGTIPGSQGKKMPPTVVTPGVSAPPPTTH